MMGCFDWASRPTLLLAGAVLLAGLMAGPAAAAEFELKFGSTNSSPRSLEETMMPFARALEADSKGRIAVDVRPAGGFGPMSELLQQLESGKVDMALMIPSYYPGRFPRTTVMELPTLYSSAETGSRALWQLFEQGLVAGDYGDFKMIGLLVSTPFGILTADKEVASLRDLRGMRIRVGGSVAGLAFARLGLIPLGIPSNLLGEALARDWLDALSSGFDTARGVKGKPPLMVIDQVSTLIDAQFSATPQVALMNRKSYEALPRELQVVVDQHSGLEFALRGGRSKDSTEMATKSKLAADPKYKMLSFSKADQAEIAQRIQPVFEEWVASMKELGIDGDGLLKRARELTAQPAS